MTYRINLYRENFGKFFFQYMLFFIQKVLILFNIKGFIMTYLFRFIIDIVAILTLFYVGMTLIFTPEKANITYYAFVILMCSFIGYRYIKGKYK